MAHPVEDVESRELNIRAVGSRLGESLLGCSVMTPEKRARRLAEQGSMSRFRESLEGCREAIKNHIVVLLNDFNKIYKK